MPTAEVRVVSDITELATEAAELFTWFGQQAMRAGGPFRVALSGGSTPKALYQILAKPEVSGPLDWTRTEFFFGDERCVPPDDSESNYSLASRGLFQPLKISEDRVFRMEGELPSAESASRKYEDLIRKAFRSPAPLVPRFDLILLGMGDDGHTASLFPGTAALEERSRLVVPSTSPKGVAQRITFTVPLINEAAAVMFLVSGESKAAPARTILEPKQGERERLPAGLIRPQTGRLIWLLDRDAAAQLTIAKQQVTSHEE